MVLPRVTRAVQLLVRGILLTDYNILKPKTGKKIKLEKTDGEKQSKGKINWRIDKVKEHFSEIIQHAYVHRQVVLTN